MYHNNWFDYDLKDFKINEYPNVNYTPTTLEDALVRQAKTIYNDLKPAVFISGGIDSQAMALGFIQAELDVEYVYIRPSYYGSYNKQDYFFAEQFCKKHNINLKIIDLEFDKDSLKDFLFKHDFFNTITGSGTIFLLEGIRQYKGDGIPLTSDGHFIFDNTDNNEFYHHPKCRGKFKFDPAINMDNQILFIFYYNYILQYYEYMHRTTPEIQYLAKMEAKNLIYTQLGFPFRPKMSGWEFLHDDGDYSSLSTIDWSNDHGRQARITKGINVIVEKLGISENYIKDKFEGQKDYINNVFITLYEFDGIKEK